MMKVILYLYDRLRHLISQNIPISQVMELGLFDRIVKMKYDVPNDRLEKLDDYIRDIDSALEDFSNK